MSAEEAAAGWLKRSRSLWAILAQGAAWVFGLVGGFLLPPPPGVHEGEERTWLRFAQFFVAVLVGLVLFAVFKWPSRKHARGWWWTALASLLCATSVFFVYQALSYAWTGNYFEQKVVIGSEYTDQAREYLRKSPGLPLNTLLEDFLGNAEEIWTRESINRRRLTLAAIYMLCLPGFTLCLMASIQALHCLRRPKAAAVLPGSTAGG